MLLSIVNTLSLMSFQHVPVINLVFHANKEEEKEKRIPLVQFQYMTWRYLLSGVCLKWFVPHLICCWQIFSVLAIKYLGCFGHLTHHTCFLLLIIAEEGTFLHTHFYRSLCCVYTNNSFEYFSPLPYKLHCFFSLKSIMTI